ncbi:MAG: tRNA 5-methoxyuridine(34)/uridine 5-oxyacetic acid(34) synthase CmoB [Aliidiomarina sp.]|uniref:class I SAM-dependent methyltransferase n=1 Tax=Aliidiomarina sp. TaxID=1872439 RepID=UPI0025C0B603|nr:DUF1698 domain-containing protein [Aliidiomarina sp.]MCH8502334.1 tRNA 5-methoxyuridine(34)/uridine 5-oxyacetic acid(34) synthase CmoB [Aliidiomarina sp.]
MFTQQDLELAFSKYKVSNLVGISEKAFYEKLTGEIGRVDHEIEGYKTSELEQQRDLSLKFHWGHNHDFGSFKLEGRMGDRHLNLLSTFCDLFDVPSGYFENKNILDVGCWTGGTTLLLSALGANVTAVEEVQKYANMAEFLAQSFGLQDSVKVHKKSLYNLTEPHLKNAFDAVYFPGVVYHLSDPVLGLRRLYNTLKLGGELFVESAGINVKEPYCKFQGNYVTTEKGGREELSRGGWNWFMPSPSALERMIKEAGFDDIQSVWDDKTKRVFAFARKVQHKPICKAGFSVPDID